MYGKVFTDLKIGQKNYFRMLNYFFSVYNERFKCAKV